jgi:predicted protein tyrosine phosphatase
MIHVCSLARLHTTLEETRAQHVITLLKQVHLLSGPLPIPAGNHLHIGVDDIAEPIDGHIHPAEEHVVRLIDFVHKWERSAPLVVHCYAGISRSTAAAFIALCTLNPGVPERTIARLLREASPTAYPNRLLVTLADAALERTGRMIEAVESIGRGLVANEAHPFSLPADLSALQRP